MTCLRRIFVLFYALTVFDGFLKPRGIVSIGMKILCPVGIGKTIETTSICSTFKCLFIRRAKINTLGEVENGFVFTVFLSGLDNGVYRSGANTFHRPHSKADCSLLVHGKFIIGFVYIWSQYLKSHP